MMFEGKAAASLNQTFDRFKLAGIEVCGFDSSKPGDLNTIEIPVQDSFSDRQEEPPTPMKPPKKKNKFHSQTKQVKNFLDMFKDDYFDPLEHDDKEMLDTVVCQVEKPENLYKRVDAWLTSKGITVSNPESKKIVFYERKRSVVSQKLSNSNSPVNFFKQGIKSDSTEDSETSQKPLVERQVTLRARLVDSVGSIPEIAIIGEFSKLSTAACSLPTLGKALSTEPPGYQDNLLESSPNFERSKQEYSAFKQHKNSLDLSLSNFQ